jgi:SAM-dependent methyltransferase
VQRSPYPGALTGWASNAVQSARRVIPLVLELVQPRSVVDVGCGFGAWLSVFSEYGLSDFLGIDGTYVATENLLIPADKFLGQDITNGVHSDRAFDLGVCLEVGEHLPAESARVLVRDLVQLAPVILFSAAVPGQGGIGHVNEQWPAYWAALFAEHGYLPVDAIRPVIWNDSSIDWFYRQNTLFFATAAAIADRDGLRAAVLQGPLLPVVHPAMYRGLQLSRQELTTRQLVKALPGAVLRSIRFRLDP